MYRAEVCKQVLTSFRVFGSLWKRTYPTTIKRLEPDVQEPLTFFGSPRPLWRLQHTTNLIERCLVEVRRRTRHAVCFVNMNSLDRTIYAISSGMNERYSWKNRTLGFLTQAP